MNKRLLMVLTAAMMLLTAGAATASATTCVPGGARPPAVVTDHAQGVTANGATLRGKVDAHGCPTTYRFEYGPTTDYGSATPDSSAGSGTQSILAAANLNGLPPNTLFHFRIVAISPAGTTYGGDLPFKTKVSCLPGGARPPAVVTDPAAGVTGNGAILRGKVNAHGCPTMYRFEYGPTIAYGKVTPELAAGPGTKSIQAAVSVSTLTPHTLFHFRIVATSAAGSTSGADFSFTTGSSIASGPGSVRVIGVREVVKRRFVAVIHLSCSALAAPCHGTLRVYRHRQVLGRKSVLLAPDSTGVVRLRLNRRGRILLDHQRKPRVTLAVRGTPNMPPTSVLLIRQFRVR